MVVGGHTVRARTAPQITSASRGIKLLPTTEAAAPAWQAGVRRFSSARQISTVLIGYRG